MNLLKHENRITKAVVLALLLGIIVIVLVIFVYYLKGYINRGEVDPSLFGAFGDFIGGVIGTIFTLVATILILLTYYSQKAELQATNRIASFQAQTLKRQTFESTFFNMLNFLERSRSGLEITKPQTYLFADYNKVDYLIRGIESFSVFYPYLIKEIKEMSKANPHREENNIYNSVRRSIDTLNIKFYFDQVNVLYEYLESESEVVSKLYYAIIFAQFSKYEKLFIFYVGISKIYPAIYRALEENKVFDNFEFINELQDTRHLGYYSLEDNRFGITFSDPIQ